MSAKINSLRACIDGIGLIGPGFPDWPTAQSVLRGESPYVPAASVLNPPAALPPAERRRTGRIVKLALAVGFEAVRAAAADASRIATVFSSSGADGDNCHAICETLASADRLISPTRFHNSVHNAASGYWGIASGSMAPSTSICTYDATFAAGMLEAVAQVASSGDAVLLVACDTPYPEPLHSARPLPECFGISLLLSPQPGDSTLASVALSLGPDPVSTLDDPALEALRTAIPAARGLPLLQALASSRAATVTLEYLAGLHLTLQLTP